MASRAARIAARHASDRKSTGPKPPEARQARPAEPPAPAPVAAEVPYPHREAAEVDRRTAEFCDELQCFSQLGQTLARVAAVMSVRAERCYDHENAMLVERTRKALAEFTPPPGLGAAEAQRLRAEVEARAQFDPSDEARQARKYEAAALRTFARALQEIRRLKRDAEAKAKAEVDDLLASFSPGDLTDDEFDAWCAAEGMAMARPANAPSPLDPPIGHAGRFEIPLTIGRPR